jgi:menaquinone-dependent protoporphyrinogen oxidase
MMRKGMKKEKIKMENKVLVTYASKYGSTQEVAETIAATLRDRGLSADLQPMRKVRTLAGYDAVVLGAPIYYGLWHKDAVNFLTKNEADLAQRPVAVFALGPNSTDEDERRGCRAQFDKELAKFLWLKPVVTDLFGGRFPARLRFPDSMVAALPASPMHGKPSSDVRDWTAIRAWANGLVAQLRLSCINREKRK